MTAVAVCISTLTTKQHVIWDVAAGILLAELGYWAVAATKAADLYRRAMLALTARVFHRRGKRADE